MSHLENSWQPIAASQETINATDDFSSAPYKSIVLLNTVAAEGNQPGSSDFRTGFFVGVIVCFIFMVLLLRWAWRARCPNCQRWFSLQKTGVKKKGGWFSETLEEAICCRCGHKLYQRPANRGDGGRGD